jgi:hypothetical protein
MGCFELKQFTALPSFIRRCAAALFELSNSGRQIIPGQPIIYLEDKGYQMVFLRA